MPSVYLDNLNLDKARQLVKSLYRDEEDNPFILADGQCQIFLTIFQRLAPRCHLMAYTQYGKSLVVALATLTRIATYPEKWILVAGREKQAKIIMGYIIQHVFDNAYTKNKLEISKKESLERIRRERSKNRLTFKHTDGTIGEVLVLSADARNKQLAGEAIMGFGAPNVVLDEGSLVDDDIEAKIFRMLGGKPDNFYLKISNPWRRNHFYKDFIDEDFLHINIPWQQGVKEGRITQEFINEARKKPLFDILYENKFPPADLIDEEGYMPLLSDKDLRITQNSFAGNGVVVLGVDPSGEGSDETLWVVRDNFSAQIVGREPISTSKTIAQKTITFMQSLNVQAENVFIDNFGVGANVAQEMGLTGLRVNAVNVGEKATDQRRFYNKRAECYWRIRDWLFGGGELIQHDGWQELLGIKYRAEFNGKLKIKSKREMLAEGIRSPNVADALSLTFYKLAKRQDNDYEHAVHKFLQTNRTVEIRQSLGQDVKDYKEAIHDFINT